MSTGRKLFHFSALAFTAFWLVATSRAREPARHCFVPLAKPVLDVTLGPHLTTSGAPSCSTLDGLAEGELLRARIRRSANAPQVRNLACWGYDIATLAGLEGVSNVTADEASAQHPSALLDLTAKFSSTTEPDACWGDYHLVLEPASAVSATALLDPLQAAASGQRWRVVRRISVGPNDARQCAALPPLPDGYCEDTFEVKSIAHAP